ncbi:MAG: hypothetical protein LBQ93_02455, partial [Treponema sp.]|nr:hypothetical protein [Treponema sp.]
RAVGAGNDLAKVLADNSIVSVLSGNQDVPPVKEILRSPVDGRKDIYILFDYDWLNMGTLIHVKEDGTVKGVFKDVFYGLFAGGGNLAMSTIAEELSFDPNGNLYYIKYVQSGFEGRDSYYDIYKYNPVTYKEERIIRLEASRYANIQLSQDGNYVLAQSAYDDVLQGAGLRIIPVANPSAAYLIDKVGGKTVYVQSFGLNKQKNEIYFYGHVCDDGDLWSLGDFRLHKLSSNSFSKDDWELTTLDTQPYDFSLLSKIIIAPDNSVWCTALNPYNMFAKLLNSNGQPDFKIPNVFSSDGGGSLSFFSGQYVYFFGWNNSSRGGYYRARIDNPENAENLLTDPKLAAKFAKDDTQIWSYNVAGNDLYISGIENPVWDWRDDGSGTLIEGDFFSGKIDMSTSANTYTEFSGLGQVTAIVGY